MVTTIQIKNRTREKLKTFGYKGESYDELLDRLMNYCEELNVEEYIEREYQKLQKEKHLYTPMDEAI